MALSETQIVRYSRHVLLPDMGGVGQQALLDATVVVDIGVYPAAATTALLYLAAAGVGRLLVRGPIEAPVTDDDVVGGILYAVGDVGRARLGAIRDRLTALNPDVSVLRAGAADADDDDAAIVALPAPTTKGPSVAGALIAGGDAAVRTLTALYRR